MEPLAVYDRIDETYNISELPIILCFSGSFHESGDVHGRLREEYLQNKPEILNYYQSLAELSWRSRFTLMSHNWKRLGYLFRENTKIMNNVMKSVGFEHGIGLFNNIMI